MMEMKTYFLAKPLCRLLENTLLTIGSLILKKSLSSSGPKIRDSLYVSVTEHKKRAII